MNICTTLKVLIVAKCIVNAVVIEDESVIPGVLIVAKCIVNIDNNPSEARKGQHAKNTVLIVAKCIVN